MPADFSRALYAELFDSDDPDDLEQATREWACATAIERSFAQVHLLWLIHERLAELGDGVTDLTALLTHLNTPPDGPEILDAITVDAEVQDA